MLTIRQTFLLCLLLLIPISIHPRQRPEGNIHRLRHLRQLHAINTMVGTAPANIASAGLFGKGSEEHGQTLPAVLYPHGQNAWTPQTRDTEQKCVAPYYYTDSLFQGFRNSHWIVGGCTQDYGSFTVAAITGNLRTTPAARATPFTHSQEVSHPHYYGVRLPYENLFAELTATSHTALLRITADVDTIVHIVINPNSDEGQGYICLDTLRHIVYGYNPVHRIYQGWGQPAGFSGHFMLRFTNELIGFGTFEDSLVMPRHTEIRQQPSPSDLTITHHPTLAKPVGVFLTFRIRKQQPLQLIMASSFTDRLGCERNLQTEAAGKSFEQMRAELADHWISRLHTIDIDDPDEAHIVQFYGALYRASFLPREFSDADGRRPLFAGATAGLPFRPLSPSQTFYTDFSAWDTFRALHPLLTIIAPTLDAQMVQSLVTMATEGGWMPIFPCWNSYTAAMIGDHCSAIIADAFVKGIEGVDYTTAYRYMLQNAFFTPTNQQYLDGKGRRANQSYLHYGYIPLEDPVAEAYHTGEQTSRTLEYAYDDFCVAQLARHFGTETDYDTLIQRSHNWQNVFNPATGWVDGRHSDGTWENNNDLIHRQAYITEGAISHYTWFVPHDVPALIQAMGGPQSFEQKLDTMFFKRLYWHGNEPCHQIPFLYNYIGRPDKTRERVRHILATEYADTPGGLSGNDDAGQMSAWFIFASLGFYPVCPGTPLYAISEPTFRRITLNLENGRRFTLEKSSAATSDKLTLHHSDILRGTTLKLK